MKPGTAWGGALGFAMVSGAMVSGAMLSWLGCAGGTDLTSAFCERVSRCEANHGRYVAGVSECEAWVEEASSCHDATPDERTACAEWLAEANCDMPLFPVAGLWDSTCDSVFGLQRASSGDNCAGATCELGTYCHGLGQANCDPVCLPLPSAGQACNYDFLSGPFVPCAPGNQCTADSQCAARLAIGESCLGHAACESTNCAGGLCAEPLTEGDPCEATDLCTGTMRACINGVCNNRPLPGEGCVDDLECIFGDLCDDGVCVRYSTCRPHELGARCRVDSECEPDVYCDVREAAPTCKTRLRVDDACLADRECPTDAHCDNSTNLCRRYLGVGEPCGEGRCIASTRCGDDGAGTEVCLAGFATGELCARDDDCLSGRCDLVDVTCAERESCQP